MIMLSKYWNYGIGGRDAVLLATMVMNSVNEIMTHDGAFKKLVVFHHQLKFTSSRYNFNLTFYKS